jgi:hypothetical protein
MSMKTPVTQLGIDPGTVRLVAQRLNDYANPGPRSLLYNMKNLVLTDNIMLIHYSGQSVNFV